MKKPSLISRALIGAVSAFAVVSTAGADLVFPSLSYRTGPFAVNGIPFADGYADYMTLLNERDGGIGGSKINVIECETAYNTQKGVECYESTKGEGALVYNPLSTGITYQLIPKATSDGIPVLTMGYGRTSAANGKVFSHIFNFPVNYWHGASIGVNHMLELNNNDLNGKKVTLLHFDGAYGREPIPTLEALSEKHGFNFSTIAIEFPGQEQKSQWLQIRRERPDYLLFWGWGVMNQVAIKEAAAVGYPMENFIGIWWSGSEVDVTSAGPRANGYKSLAFHQSGTNFPVFDDLKKHVIDAGKTSGNGDQVGTVLYNRGMYNAFLVTEAARKAQEIHGTADLTPEQMRDGLEALVVNEALMAKMGLPGFGPEFEVSCDNHGGPGLGAVQQWDASAKQWKLITDFAGSDMSVIQPLIDADSAAFAAEAGVDERDCA